MLRNSWLRGITPKHLRSFGEPLLMIKAVVASRGVLISSHGELFSYIRRLNKEGNLELRRLFSVASTLHQNFHKNQLSGDVVKEQRT